MSDGPNKYYFAVLEEDAAINRLLQERYEDGYELVSIEPYNSTRTSEYSGVTYYKSKFAITMQLPY